MGLGRYIGIIVIFYAIASFLYIGRFVPVLFEWFPWSGYIFDPIGTFVFQTASGYLPLNPADASSGLGHMLDMIFYPGLFLLIGIIAVVKGGH